MPDLESFEADVKKNIKLLSSKNADTRRKAAVWLGEAGDPSAITALTQAYKHDRDSRVREAARYSLGMFRALEEAWNIDQNLVGELLEEVALNGRMGRRVPVPVRTVTKLALALLLSAALVAALAFILPEALRPGGRPVPPTPVVVPDRSRAELLADLRDRSARISASTEALRREFQTALAGGAPDCDAAFDLPDVYLLSINNQRDYPALVEIAARLEQSRRDFESARESFEAACAPDAEPLTAETISPLLADLGGISAALADLDAALADIEAEPDAAPTDAETAEPTPTPGPTETPVAYREHLVALQSIIDSMTGQRGANTLMIQYWEEARSRGATDGCRDTPPTIPADYTLPADVAASVPDLALAANLVNTGLRGVRDNWAVFTAACGSGTPGASAEGGLTRANAAAIAFENAAGLVRELRGGS